MQKLHKLAVGVFLWIYLLVGCLATSLPNEKKTPDLGPTNEVLTLTPTVVSSSNANDTTEGCPRFLEGIPNDLQGLMVLKEDSNEEYFFLNLKNLEIQGIRNSYNFITSSKHDMLAYIDSSDPDYRSWKIIVITSDLTEISIERRENWSDYLNLYQITNQGMILVNSGESYLLIDPSTNTEQEVTSHFPNQKPSTEISQWSGTIYDPEMQFAVYPRNPGDENNKGRIVLWNMKSQMAVTYISSNDVYGSEPKWAPDGRKFAIVLSQLLPNETEDRELYIVDTNGKTTKLTNLSITYPQSFISNYQWSPDNRKIAFWLIHQVNNSKKSLMILDVETSEITAYCYSSEVLTDPIWSPDSQWLSIRIESETQPIVISINVINDRVIKIADHATPISWIDAP